MSPALVSDPYTLAAVALVFLAVGICVNHWIAAPERRAKDEAVSIAQTEALLHQAAADTYRNLYRNEVKVNSYYLSLFGGDNPIALEAEARTGARDLPVSLAAPLAAETWLKGEVDQGIADLTALLDVLGGEEE